MKWVFLNKKRKKAHEYSIHENPVIVSRMKTSFYAQFAAV